MLILNYNRQPFKNLNLKKINLQVIVVTG